MLRKQLDENGNTGHSTASRGAPPAPISGPKKAPTAPGRPTLDPSKPPMGVIGAPTAAANPGAPTAVQSSQPVGNPAIQGQEATSVAQDPTGGDAVGMHGGIPTPKPIDQSEEDFIRSLLTGANSVDTSEQEKLIHELIGDQTGQALVDQRASMGRAGFGSSGALGAMEGDIRRKAGQGESQAILDERNRAKQEAIDNALKGVGADVNLREAGMNDWLMQQILAIANGGDGATGDANGDGVVTAEEEQNAISQQGDAHTRADADKQAEIRRQADFSRQQGAPTATGVPDGAEMVTDPNHAAKEGYVLFRSRDGSYVWVKADAAKQAASGSFSDQTRQHYSGGVKTS